jgi:hypothetical protein
LALRQNRNMIRTASDDWRRKLDAKAFKWANRAAKTRFREDVTGFLAELLSKLNVWIDGAEVRTRMDETGLIGVLESKPFQVLAQTGTSSSGVNKSYVRADDEFRIFGIDPNAPPDERPIYGYLEGSDESGAVAGYGIVVGFHDCVRDKVTFVLGDTRDSNLMGAVFSPVPVLAPSIEAFSIMRDGLLDARTLADACHGEYGYAEVQIHGGLTSKAIARVVYTRGTEPSPRATELLREHRIELVRVAGDDPGSRGLETTGGAHAARSGRAP